MKNSYALCIFLLIFNKNNAQLTARVSNGSFFLPNAAWTNKPFLGSKGTYFADVTGDGKADAIAVSKARISVKPSNGNAFNSFIGNKPWTLGPFFGTKGIYFADVNGDGKADAISVSDDYVSVRLSDGAGFVNYLGNKPWTAEPYFGTMGTYFADVNGDGKADAIVVKGDRITVRISDGTQFLPNASWTTGSFYGTRATYFADVTGDGKADAIAVNANNVIVYPSDGTRFFTYRGNKPWIAEPYYGTKGTYFADVNGDKKADAIVVNDNLVTVRISDGNQFLPNESWTKEPYYGNLGTYFADADGDGKADAIVVNGPMDQPDDDFVDSDNDGISDETENLLLTRFRPYYKFSLDDGSDPYHPIDAFTFMRNSDLKATGGIIITAQKLFPNPFLILSASTAEDRSADLKVTGQASNFSLDLPDNMRKGEMDWSIIQSEAIGLYGHVRPLYENADLPEQVTGYKIEYWQFYAFNDAPVDHFTHEGDWETVQLVVEADLMTIRTVIHNVHGSEIVFNISQGKRVDLGNGFIEYQGTGFDRPFRGYIDLNVKGPAGIGRAQQNLVRLFCENNECTHPVVYIEHSGHASWPTEYWSWIGARKHNGDDVSYLVTTPCNLGEIDFPNNRCGATSVILRFNGKWGGSNDSPLGPTLQSWKY